MKTMTNSINSRIGKIMNAYGRMVMMSQGI